MTKVQKLDTCRWREIYDADAVKFEKEPEYENLKVQPKCSGDHIRIA